MKLKINQLEKHVDELKPLPPPPPASHSTRFYEAQESYDKNQTHLSSSQLANQQELKALREKSLDQAEQIDVLVSELAKYRNDGFITAHLNSPNVTSDALNQAKNEIDRLNNELTRQRLKCDDLLTSNETLQMLLSTQTLTNSSDNQGYQQEGRNQFGASLGYRPKAMDSRGLEGDVRRHEEIRGGYSTSTQFNDDGQIYSKMSQALEERGVQVQLYQVGNYLMPLILYC